MPQRRSSLLLVVVLVASAFAAPSIVTGGGPYCTPGHEATEWTDQFHPPPTIRVLRSNGPNDGHVETVDFWHYVGTVLRAEYSSGGDKPYPWMQIGATSIKQYAWYYAIKWRGGRVAHTVDDGNGGTITTYECFDVKDTTADQIYRPEKWSTNLGQWIEANVPTEANLKGMRDSWHITMRKWSAKKKKSRFFLTGYRSGTHVPCGQDAGGFRIYQKSLRDCGIKLLEWEEVMREYYEPNLLIVDPRSHDVLTDGGQWRGDLGLLTGDANAVSWRLFRGTGNGFDADVENGSFNGLNYANVIGHGTGDANGIGDPDCDATPLQASLGTCHLADLIFLVSGTPRKLYFARANGSGYDAPVSQNLPSDLTVDRMVVADFNGDTLADVGLLRSTPVEPTEQEAATLVVMKSLGNGTFADPIDWWRGELTLTADPLASDVALAGDVNGDAKADLVVRKLGSGDYVAAVSAYSCSDMSSWGTCPSNAVGGNGLGAASTWRAAETGWTTANTRHVVGDFNGDGRDDIEVLVKDGSAVDVFVLRAQQDESFAAPQKVWEGARTFEETFIVAANMNFDHLDDLALVYKNGSNTTLSWLRAIEQVGNTPASMTSTTALDTSVSWSATNRPY